MKIESYYDRFDARNILLKQRGIWDEIISVINACPYHFGENRPNEIKLFISKEFNRLGWADKVPIKQKQNLTISFLKNRVGICVQLGNVARTYSDLLKLSYLYNKEIIDVGVMIVPNRKESKLLGANYASFDRLIRELDIFIETINSPIVVMGISQ